MNSTLVNALRVVSLFVATSSVALAGIARTLGNAGVDPQTLHGLDAVGVGGLIGGSLVPVPLMFLGLLVCVVQAFVFALLTTIYIALSVEHHDSHGGHAAH